VTLLGWITGALGAAMGTATLAGVLLGWGLVAATILGCIVAIALVLSVGLWHRRRTPGHK
jgi:uncharacterized membrane protein